MTRWSFLGAGAMAGAMVRGLISANAAKPEDISCIGGADPTAGNLARATGIRAVTTFAELLGGADVMVLACKPQNLESLPPELSVLTKDKLVISIVAGKRLSTIARLFPEARNLVRVMPNTPAQIGAGTSGWCTLSALTESDEGIATTLLGAMGRAVRIDEADMDALTAISGSGPAYVFEFTAALREAGVEAGLSSETASILAQETVLGAARLMARSEDSPETLRDRVTSPNGTTFAALQVFARRGFRDLIREAVTAARDRSKELSADD